MTLKLRADQQPVDPETAQADIPNWTELDQKLRAWARKNPDPLSPWRKRKGKA